MVMSGILALPEDCIAAVISFTSPRDAGRLACVSTTFRSAADSDGVWDSFVPRENLSANSSLSKKELYLHSCHYLNDGKLCFWFDLPSGKKCYMISARELNIFDLLWHWIPLVRIQQRLGIHGRFPEVAKLEVILRFEIGGKISTSLLSPQTTYVAYLVFAEGFISHKDDDPVGVTVGLAGSNNGFFIFYTNDEPAKVVVRLAGPHHRTVYFHRVQQDGDNDGFFPKKRADGWLESELGEFFNGGDEEGELSITIKSRWKEHLIVQGIEIRPKKNK
ncbi:hypothetical protein LWI29_008778 [Acer saccharum]|uniref:F-box domain-containing protein n=1 Tax=Acer saccharum TaxID=4024 RepID=A0AA39VFN5_ACESA|nr:hypothetical protein LWI29_008778 [Acer saccharum]